MAIHVPVSRQSGDDILGQNMSGGCSSISTDEEEEAGAGDSDDNNTKNCPVVTKTVHEYAEATSIHGIAYIFESGRLSFERLLWLILVLVFGFMAFIISMPLLNNFLDNPVLTTVHTSGYPIENVQFPSITICGQGSVNEVVGEYAFAQRRIT